MTGLPIIRREIVKFVRHEERVQGKPWYMCERDWPQCPLINPGCPDDLCILPAGHPGTAEHYHVLGTVPYDSPMKFPAEWMMPEGTPIDVLYEAGYDLAEEMWPRDT